MTSLAKFLRERALVHDPVHVSKVFHGVKRIGQPERIVMHPGKTYRKATAAKSRP